MFGVVYWHQIIVVFLVGLLVSNSAIAEDITSAFGIPLGKKWEDSFAISPSTNFFQPDKTIVKSTQKDFKQYEFNSVKQNKYFQDFEVRTTHGNIIYQIEASDIVQGKSSCFKKMDTISKIISSKYGVSGNVTLVTDKETENKNIAFSKKASLIVLACNGWSFYGSTFFKTDEDYSYQMRAIYYDFKHGGQVNKSNDEGF